ncbi:MAG TPA: hypothetical protein VMR21_13690 [Vicinamibacteria bacterium]|nr:hypothetical protein [Vicinamibacteria bacterium]
MAKTLDGPPTADNDRRNLTPNGRPVMAGIQVRPEDVEPAKGLHRIAKLFRILSGLLVLLMAMQVTFGLTGTVPISLGVLFAEAIRLLIFAGVLWGAGDLADLYVKSHHETRATRILLARLTYRLAPRDEAAEDEPERGPGDGANRH